MKSLKPLFGKTAKGLLLAGVVGATAAGCANTRENVRNADGGTAEKTCEGWACAMTRPAGAAYSGGAGSGSDPVRVYINLQNGKTRFIDGPAGLPGQQRRRVDIKLEP
ncbi:MAG: hypothetical protein ABTQ34_08280 [Bdellovibrionales bacterium]